MKTFTEQIRESILKSGVTPYVLANDAGISESVLSRFLNGGSGLTLKTLDALAVVLGWEIIQTVQRTSMPQKRGRKPKEGKMKVATKAEVNAAVKASKSRTKTASQSELAKAVNMEEASRYARSAHEDHFSSRRGVWEIGDPNRLCIYNNNPYKDASRRPLETTTLRTKLKAMGIEELAYAEYGTPPEGSTKGKYSYAMIVRATAEQAEDIINAMQESIRESDPETMHQLSLKLARAGILNAKAQP